jgi:hypothetical protein
MSKISCCRKNGRFSENCLSYTFVAFAKIHEKKNDFLRSKGAYESKHESTVLFPVTLSV